MSKMLNINNLPLFEMIYVIVNCGLGSRVLHKAKEYGIRGGTVFIGRGTVRNTFLNFLSLTEERKEIILFGADKMTSERALIELDKTFQFAKPGHGIAFSINTCGVAGSRCYQCKDFEESRGVHDMSYQLIITIINKGKAEDVVEAAQTAGSKGGTIINARGSGVHETSKLFSMDIEPEREIVLILVRKSITEQAVEAIQKKLNLDQPGNGIVFIQDVNKAYGIYEED